jgi:hypothetical protein
MRPPKMQANQRFKLNLREIIGETMKLHIQKWALLFVLLPAIQLLHAQELRYVQQRTANGVLEGVVSPDGKVRTFKGIPYAAPPLGLLRWKAPQPFFVLERRPESR